MSAILELEKTVLALPLRERLFLAQSLLGSLPPAEKEMTEAEEMAEVERRERELESGQVTAISEAEFWQHVDADAER